MSKTASISRSMYFTKTKIVHAIYSTASLLLVMKI